MEYRRETLKHIFVLQRIAFLRLSGIRAEHGPIKTVCFLMGTKKEKALSHKTFSL